MASDDEFYYYDDDGEDEGGEDAEAAADWDGLALEADEDDLGLAEDDTPLRQSRADCWVSIAAGRHTPVPSDCVRVRATGRDRGDLSLPVLPVRRQARPNFAPPFFFPKANFASLNSALGVSAASSQQCAGSAMHPSLQFLTRSASGGMGFVSVNAD
jgi:hypothetical protein